MSEIKHLKIQQGTFELNIPFMSLPDTGLSVLTGASGSGKSTLLEALCGFKKSSKAFSWLFKGRDLAKLAPPERNLSVLFQDLHLFSGMSGRDNVFFPARAKNLNREQQKNRWEILEESLKLSPFINQAVYQLSGGQKQRVALARAFMTPGCFLLLDEPFSFLNGELKQVVLSLIFRFSRAEGFPVLCITHDVDLVKGRATKVLTLKEGKLLKKDLK